MFDRKFRVMFDYRKVRGEMQRKEKKIERKSRKKKKK